MKWCAKCESPKPEKGSKCEPSGQIDQSANARSSRVPMFSHDVKTIRPSESTNGCMAAETFRNPIGSWFDPSPFITQSCMVRWPNENALFGR